MSILDLLNQLGEDGFKCQILLEAISNIRTRKIDNRSAAEVSFLTDAMSPNDVVMPSLAENIGIVVWVPRAKYDEIMAKKS